MIFKVSWPKFVFLCMLAFSVDRAVAQDFFPNVEIKAGYFNFSEKKMRKIYDSGGLDLQISGSVPIWRFIQLYGSVEYLERHGKSLNIHQKTRVYEVPLSLGVNPILEICDSLQCYFAFGARYFLFYQRNESEYVDKHINQRGLGCFLNSTLKFFPARFMYLLFFGEYSYGKIRFFPSYTDVFGEKTQVGGFTFGFGLGFSLDPT